MAQKRLFVLALLLLLSTTAFSQVKNADIVNFISSAYSVKTFTTVPVDSKDLELILHCGVQAPSARNSQPWHFTVVTDPATMKKIIRDAIDGNVLIVISGLDQHDHSAAIAFDCALAAENMYLAAQSLGLGSHIYTGPVANFNANYKDLVGIPVGYAAVAILKVGNVAQNADAVSSASRRKADPEIINYR
jgi:nitroreductase